MPFNVKMIGLSVISVILFSVGTVITSEDFEFDEAGVAPPSSGVKTWLLDPDNELCALLRCAAAEVCLLQDRYTAVCVARAEVARSGDKVVPFNKMGTGDLKSFQSLSDDEESDYFDDEDDDEDYYTDEEDLDEQDSQDAGSSDLEGPLNDEAQPSRVNSPRAEASGPLLDRQPFASNKMCGGCPLSRPVFLCGTDNRTYSSTCRLHFHNCIHNANIAISCKGFCPCAEHPHKSLPATQHRSLRLRKEDALRHNTIPHGPARPARPALALLAAKHDKNGAKAKKQHDNTISNSKKNNIWAPNECSQESLAEMGNRILDWFSVIMADASKTSRHNKAPRWCKREVAWMLGHLDADGSGVLERQELYRLEHDDRERCMRPFFDRCDLDRDGRLSGREWCKCFDKSERPCAAMRTASLGQGNIPECDSEGWYAPVQCRAALCWCVDRHGAELPFTRTHGKPQCGDIAVSKKLMKSQLRIDDEDDAKATMMEGSADTPLDI